ncbi:hypothetical protein GQ44DRAFT_773290 [Phaeosphaeriaceae sp. PMI808]|nr:hypothetical protein GQ44DRAFT_773290 [Phaeosphaeriaceae sp. PMI808]
MNARGHDLAQSAAAHNDTAITVAVPASPPRRDPVEDVDHNFTRKRPRLDSGSISIRALSTDPEPATNLTAEPRELPVAMTIRPHPPSSPVLAAAENDCNAGNGISALPHVPHEPHDHSPILVPSTVDETGSPPVMLIDDDEPAVAFTVHMDAEDHFRRFPFTRLGSYANVVREIPQYIQGSTPIDGQLLPCLTEWLLDLPEPSVDVQGFYISKAVFWDDFGALVNKLLARRYQWITALSDTQSNDESRYPFGDHFGDDIQTGQIFYQFFSAYVRLCSFLIQVDIHFLSIIGPEELYLSTLLSQRHIRYLHNVIRTDKMPVFHVLQKEYAADVRDMATRLHKDFLGANGAQNLLRLANALYHQVPHNIQNIFATNISQLFSLLGWTIFELAGANTYIDRSDFHRGALSFFHRYGNDLQDPSKPIDAGVARDLIQYYSALVLDLCQWDEGIAAELVTQMLEFGGPDSPTTSSPVATPASYSSGDYRQDPACYPNLVANAWKFKILRKYIVKGNMGMRVMSIATMDAALVEIWRDFSNIDPSCKHPVMQYLADFLLHGQVVDYIVSVDSHPQLISRSGNIVGFLVVTHRWSNSQADAIWRTVSTSPDPRVVTATMTMLRSIISLMRPSDLFYLCTKLHDLPIDRYTLDILRFLRDLTNRIGDNLDSVVYDGREHTSRPWNVCIRMLRDTAPSRDTDKNMLDLHAEANDQLRLLAPTIPLDERHTIYRECAEQIAERSEKATGNFKVICILAYSLHPGDTLLFQHNNDLMRSVLEEIPAFVQSETGFGPYQCQIQALHYRLDLLKITISQSGMTIPVDLYKDLWDHLIGERALSKDARNHAWAQLLLGAKSSPDNDFCKQLVLTYIPTMGPHLYTDGLYEFVASYDFLPTRQKVQTEHGDDTRLQIPGASLLWPIILSSPTGIIEDRAARLLASRYVNIIDTEGVSLSEAEDSHVALVEQCMKELRAAVNTLPKKSQGQTTAGATDSEHNAKMRHTAEVRIERILLFQKMLLEFVRQKAAFNRSRRVDSKVDAIVGDVPFGDAITVRYQCGNERQCVTMGPDHTIDDLYRRLCHATGFTKINLFARGKRLNVFDKSPPKLSDIDLGGQVIVQRAEGADLTRPLPEMTAGSSAFEIAIVNHFDELFAWMDSDDLTACLLFDFLSVFPARSAVADSVTSGIISSDELFPPGKVFQARYAAQALQTRLREHIRNTVTNEVFLSNAVQHLEKALLNKNLIRESLSCPRELQLAAVLVGVLLEFLRERPLAETSASYFSDSRALINRLMKIIVVALKTPDFAQVAQDAYATILETSLHSRIAWETFISHTDTHLVHQMLLLAQPNQTTREHVARKIASICGGDLPSTCPITKAETAARFWALISAILPDAVQYPGQSQQLFEIAEHVFRSNDEYDRNEQHLRSKLAEWSTMLMSHEHTEFPEREEIDHVVHGLTKLLLCCVLSLKSFKKPVNSGSLMTDVFKKYLFVVNVQAKDDPSTADHLPVLESHTRQELYDLMLGLAEDRTTYDTLLQLAGDIETEEIETVLSPNLVDRSMEIRSSTGYVGLYNPRAICYMNSLLTQLFMNLNFRQFILSLDVKEISAQRLLFETQRLFAQMQNSFRKSTDPRDFAACVRSLDKTPIDITVQMDADEFYNLLFDQWEAQLLRQEHKQRFRSFYGGQILNQIKSKECEHVSERAEPFFAVQCDVQGKANLQESLQAYVQGDVMEGGNKYKCESCDGRFVDAVKRTCLKDAPDNLIFHLKRFEFDLNDFSRRKIYDHFAFPETLDISPYKIDHLADPSKPCAEDLFDLVGVLVHTGTCENGHYYSYIRERPCSNRSMTPTWIEFNDSDVGPFNPAEIADRTFGGFAEVEGYARQIKQYSAYMLFYQRRTAVDEDQQHWMTTSSDRTPKIAVPKPFIEEADSMNKQFIREYSLFDPVHAKFLRQLHSTARTVNHGTCSQDHVQETRAIRIVLAHLGHIAWRQHNPEVFLELLPQLRKSMTTCAACCNVTLLSLATDDQAVTSILLKCPHPKIRSQMRSLIIDGLKYLREKEPALYGIDASDSEMELDLSSQPFGALLDLTHKLRMTVDETMDSVRGWEDFYLMLTQMAEMGHVETAALLNNGFLQFCLKLFCHAHLPFKNEAPEFARIMEKRRSIFNRLICFVWKLLSHMDLRLPLISEIQGRDRQATLYGDQLKFPFTTREKSILLWWSEDLKAIAVIDKILEVFDVTKVDHFYPGDIVKWMLETSDEHVQTNLYRTMAEGINLDAPYCDAYVHAALPFCEACPRPELISKVITHISKAIGSQTRTVEERAPSGDAVLRCFDGLLKAENEYLFEQRDSHAFHYFLMVRSRQYGIALLCHQEDRVRKATFNFFQQLYHNEEAMSPENSTTKYNSMRELLSDMILKFAYEKEVGRHRSFLVPLVDTCRMFVHQLYILAQLREPEFLQFQDVNDTTLIFQFQQEVETRMRIWPNDEGTPLSQGEPFDQSDYGSESDDHELLDT